MIPKLAGASLQLQVVLPWATFCRFEFLYYASCIRTHLFVALYKVAGHHDADDCVIK
jgi:hypothetical protein